MARRLRWKTSTPVWVKCPMARVPNGVANKAVRVAQRPALYRMATKLAVGALGLMAQGKGAFRSLPLAGGWTQGRDLPVPEGGTFMDRYAKTKRGD